MPKCQKCGCNWIAKVAHPVSCPQCKSREWNNVKMDQRHKCYVCNYSWLSKLLHPVACPQCKTKSWDGIHDYKGRRIEGRNICTACGAVHLGIDCLCGNSGTLPDITSAVTCKRCFDRGFVNGCPECLRVYVRVA